MAVERSNFLVIAAALAAGGAGGWFLHKQGIIGSDPVPAKAEAAVTPPAAQPVTSVIVVDRRPAPPTCDDSTGAAEECPSVGPSDEGGCANVVFKRCGDFKAAFKPKVAQSAVACLRSLKGAALCDPARVNLCGHTALVAACQEPTSSSSSSTIPANLTLDAGANDAAPSAVTTACESIVKSCGSEPLRPTMNDCKQTLSGMNDAGRASMATCMATHCSDRGLLGCEAMKQ